MDSTRVVMGPIGGQLSRQAIERLIAGKGALVRAEGWPDLLALLDRHRDAFDVLVADFDTPGAPSVEHLLSSWPTLSIAVVNLKGFDVHFHNIGSGAFSRFIGALGQDAIAEDERNGQAAIVLPHAGLGHTAYRTSAEQLPDLCAWLDAVLSRVLARGARFAETRDIAGLTIGLDTARALLGAQNAARDADALDREIRDAEARLLIRADRTYDVDLPLREVQECFALDALEQRMFWLALAPELDDRYARVIGVINDDLSRRRPTLGLMAAALKGVEGEWQLASRLYTTRPFARLGIVAIDRGDSDMPVAQASLVVSRDIVEFVLTGLPAAVDELERMAA